MASASEAEGGGGVKSGWSSVNVGSTKSHDRKGFNRRILPNGSNILSSVMKDATQNK